MAGSLRWLLFAFLSQSLYLSHASKDSTVHTTRYANENSISKEQEDLIRLRRLMKVLTLEAEAINVYEKIEKKYAQKHGFTMWDQAPADTSATNTKTLTGDCTRDAYILTQDDPLAFCSVAKTECRSPGGINYLELPFCVFPYQTWVAVVILVAWLTVMLVWLSTTVDFMCPNLITATKLLGISDSVAGVTFLAIGNGSSDLFSMISSSLSGPQGLEMAIGEVLGNGMFVFCFVQGLVALMAPFRLKRSESLRDVSFYIIGLLLTLICLLDGEAFAFLALYLIYICIVVNFDAILKIVGIQEVEKAIDPEETKPLFPGAKMVVYRFDENLTPVHEQIGEYLNPINSEKWNSSSWPERIIDIIKSPALIVQKISVPLLDNDQPNMLWNQTVTMCQMFFAPNLIFALMIHNRVSLALEEPMVQLVGFIIASVIGAACSILVFITSSSTFPPDYYPYLCFLGFVMSTQWIYTLASEIVKIILVIGISCHFDKVLLGATILAVGIGLQDLVSNIGVTRSGHPQMAAAACVGSPLLNLMLGMGFSTLIGNLFVETPYPFLSSIHIWMYLAFLIATLMVATGMMFMNNFESSFFYSATLMSIYVLFVISCILLSMITSDTDIGGIFSGGGLKSS